MSVLVESMAIAARARRIPQAARALRAARELERHDAWSPERLAAHQRELLLALVRDAAARSPFHRERLAGIELSDDLDVTALPTLDKAAMLEHFDDLVTDRRLTLAGVEAHLEDLERRHAGDELLLHEYRVMASGGTSGRRGIFVYDRSDWTLVVAGLARWLGGFVGTRPRLPRVRQAVIAASSAQHMTARMSASIDVGAHRILRLDARTPVPDLVRALNAFRPEALSSYPSVAALLADEQLAGRLRIAPDKVATTSEVRTAEMEQRIVAAWGRAPFDAYAATETGFIAADCDRHAGLHVFSDQVLLEVVDDAGRPVPPGEPGARVLVTNLVNRTQPLIRLELTDLLTIAGEPCPCGRPFPLLRAVDGRSDDVLRMPARAGGTIAVHPLTIRSPLAAIGGLRQYRVVHTPGSLRVEAVLADDHTGAADEIKALLRRALDEHGVADTAVHVDAVDAIPRHGAAGKHKLIESRT